jgi:hypothetical protein
LLGKEIELATNDGSIKGTIDNKPATPKTLPDKMGDKPQN